VKDVRPEAFSEAVEFYKEQIGINPILSVTTGQVFILASASAIHERRKISG
jgi:hypothetical protein